MKKSMTTLALLALGLIVLFNLPVLFSESQEKSSQSTSGEEKTTPAEKVGVMHIQVPPPPFSEGIFPCSECHAEMETNPERRVLEDAHDDIVLKHDEQHRWCLDCHDSKNRDMLHLADGKLVDFKESYKLCGQCHGPKLRDWRAGVHGRMTGFWNGQKKHLLCAHCHNPHTPRFKSLKPEPVPVKPERLR
jgi:hypothetical protein